MQFLFQVGHVWALLGYVLLLPAAYVLVAHTILRVKFEVKLCFVLGTYMRGFLHDNVFALNKFKVVFLRGPFTALSFPFPLILPARIPVVSHILALFPPVLFNHKFINKWRCDVQLVLVFLPYRLFSSDPGETGLVNAKSLMIGFVLFYHLLFK